MGLMVRAANVADCKDLLPLLKEFSQEVYGTTLTLTCKDLECDAFGNSSNANIQVCQDDEGHLNGYALFYYTYSTWEGRSVCVEELFVDPSQRKKGIGSSILRKVVEIAMKMGCSRCNINTLPGNPFLINEGVCDLTVAEKWLFFRMNRKEMEVFISNCKELQDITIREAGGNDYAGVRKLIQDLADYEKMPDGPKINASTLQDDSQGNKPFYRCFVAEAKGELIGYSLFFFTYNGTGPGVYMEDLYVSPQYRKKGIGMALWGSVIKTGLNIGGNRCDFAVLDWNTPSIDFYKLKGAIDMTQEKEYHFYRMTRDVMDNYVKTQ